MKASIQHKTQKFLVDLAKPLDISLRMRGDEKNPIAWYLGAPKIFPVRNGDFIGKVTAGASTNFNTIEFNPHAHGTHTECVGHITKEFHSVNDAMKQFFFLGKLISVESETQGEDGIITKKQLEKLIKPLEAEALLIRTLPNGIFKRSKQYSHSNWPYLEEDAAKYIRECGITQLLLDLPSVDKEKDEGKLLAHKAFWDFPKNTRFEACITEMIYVPTKIEDGMYLLNLQLASFENDAAPSKPVLYEILTK